MDDDSVMLMKTLIPFALAAFASAATASPYDDLAQLEVLEGWRTANGDHIAGLDPAHQIATMKIFGALAAEGKSVMVSLHDLGLAARHCTRLIVLDQGGLVADGPPQDVLTAERVRVTFGINAFLQNTPEGLIFQPLDVVA